MKSYIEEAKLLDNSFVEIEDNIVKLNNYNAEARYSGKDEINDKDFEELLNDISKVYNFKVFNNMFNMLDKKETRGNINKKYFEEIIKKYNKEPMECIKYECSNETLDKI